jgi:hypothetical protein
VEVQRDDESSFGSLSDPVSTVSGSSSRNTLVEGEKERRREGEKERRRRRTTNSPAVLEKKKTDQSKWILVQSTEERDG